MPTHQDIEAAIRQHLEATWPNRTLEPFVWTLGPVAPNFQVLRVAPSKPGEPWVYVSCGAWQAETREESRYEFFLLSPHESPSHVETLAMLANLHSSGEYAVQPAKIIEIGRPWMDEATCDHLLVSIPYPFGPKFEYLKVPSSSLTIRFLWLMPITHDEATFARNHGVEELEQKFETAGVNYLDKQRKSIFLMSKAS
ncbi:MAG: suppressor of fused domain protein [Steroidobacteraceae bacterium]